MDELEDISLDSSSDDERDLAVNDSVVSVGNEPPISESDAVVPRLGVPESLIWPWPCPLQEEAPDEPTGNSRAGKKIASRATIALQRNVYDRSRDSYSKSGMTGLVSTLPPLYQPLSSDDTTLIFESRFESGNLLSATQMNEFEYELMLQPDRNTRGHTQWFYFSVENMRTGVAYRFTIGNLLKPTSLYNTGLQPLMYSEKRARSHGVGWRRAGEQVVYYKNPNLENRYCASFMLKFGTEGDRCFLAYCHPYTYSDLQKYLRKLSSDIPPNVFKRDMLCATLAGNRCDILTITNFDEVNGKAVVSDGRPCVFLTARVHPGESNSSWIMQGMINFLVGASEHARQLRERYVFKIVPMLNPDGVIHGNYRCSLNGLDLNRCWTDPDPRAAPTIFSTKAELARVQTERPIALYCDLHGHSRKREVFLYGCDNGALDKIRLHERVFPHLLAKRSETFSYASSTFHIEKAKESCARVVVRRQLEVVNSYTLEASICGATERGTRYQFGHASYAAIARHFCSTILELDSKRTVATALAELQALHPLPRAPVVRKVDWSSSDGVAAAHNARGAPARGVLRPHQVDMSSAASLGRNTARSASGRKPTTLWRDLGAPPEPRVASKPPPPQPRPATKPAQRPRAAPPPAQAKRAARPASDARPKNTVSMKMGLRRV